MNEITRHRRIPVSGDVELVPKHQINEIRPLVAAIRFALYRMRMPTAFVRTQART